MRRIVLAVAAALLFALPACCHHEGAWRHGEHGRCDCPCCTKQGAPEGKPCEKPCDRPCDKGAAGAPAEKPCDRHPN